MIKRFIELRPFVNKIISNRRNAPAMILVNELEILEKDACTILQSLEAATTTVSGELYGTRSLVISIVSILTKKIGRNNTNF